MADTDMPARSATLVWGVKQSFRTYVEAVGGEIATDAGAEREADGAFAFTATPDNALTLDAEGRPQGLGAFLGEVRFQAHGGMLAVFMADPQVEISGAWAGLTVADSPKRTHRIEIAQLDLEAMTTDESGDILIPAALSLDGYHLLGDHYPPKTPLDPVRLRLAAR